MNKVTSTAKVPATTELFVLPLFMLLLLWAIPSLADSGSSQATPMLAPEGTYIGGSWASLNLSMYNQIFLALDGSSASDADFLVVRNFAVAGGSVHLMGGSASAGFVAAVNAHFIGINEANFGWALNSGNPDLQTFDPVSYLARGLTTPYDRVGPSFFMLRITDPAAHVVATNSDGYAVLATKKLGAGRLDVYIYSPSSGYYVDANDRAQFNLLVANMLGGTSVLPPVLVLGNYAPYITEALTSLGASWEQSTDLNWAPMDLSPYRHVFAGLDGDALSVASFQALGAYVVAGGTLNFCGGSGSSNFTNSFNANLIGVDTVNFNWVQSNSLPNVTIELPGSRLGNRLPATFNFDNAHDFAWFRQVIANMVNTDAPAITSISDIPNDQGGAVRLGWRSIWQDADDDAGQVDPASAMK